MNANCARSSCNSTFNSLLVNSSPFCSTRCALLSKGRTTWQEPKRDSGTQVLGEALKVLEKEKPLKSSELETGKEKQDQNSHPSSLRKREQEAEQNTIGTGKYSTFKGHSGECVTVPIPLNSNENDTNETKKKSEGKSMQTDSKEIQPLDSNTLSIVLREEKSASVKLLDDTAKQLRDLSLSLLQTTNDGPEVIRYPSHTNVDLGVKVLSEMRSVMKLKLDYLKFGKELVDNK